MGSVAPATLHIDTGSRWRGGQQQVLYLVEGLQRAGYQVGVVCGPGSPLAAVCRAREVRCFAVSMLGELDIVAGLRIALICRHHGFRILHLHTAHAVTLGIWAKLAMPSLRLVAVRRVGVPIRRHPLSRWKYSTALVDRIICISEAIHDMLAVDGIPAGKLVTIRSGVDLARFDQAASPNGLREELGIAPDNVVVGTVAAMTAEKDYPTFLVAASQVLQSLSRVAFCAVGDGPDRTRILAMAAELGMTRAFHSVGFHDDVRRYLRLFDVFVMASRTEGLGTSVIDALASGLPVVATRTGGIGEVVKDGQNGLLVPPGDPQALAGAICRLIRETDVRARLASHARASVAEFDIATTVQKNLQLYRDILDV